MTRFLLLCAAAATLVACSTATSLLNNDRRAAYVRDNNLSGKDSVHVMQQRLYRGMPIDHALAALGPPHSQDTTTVGGRTRVSYVYQARANAFDPGSLPRATVHAQDQAVTDWNDLHRVPRFDAYYEGGM